MPLRSTLRSVQSRLGRLGLFVALFAAPLLAGAEAGAPGAISPQGRPDSQAWGVLEIAGVQVAPGERARGGVAASQSFAGLAVHTPFLVTRGTFAGPTLCLTAGVHGDELNGVEIVRRVMEDTDPGGLSGTLIGVPIANPHGFRRSSRYLPDRRDLNRYFPGREKGSAASRIAYSLFFGLIEHCDALVDFHTGSFHRSNVPQLRADLRSPDVARLASQFGAPVVVHHLGAPGTLRRAASDHGVPCVTYEAGEPMRLREPEIASGVAGTRRLLSELGMLTPQRGLAIPEQEVYLETRWVRVDAGGILLGRVDLGHRVQRGELLGSVTDPISNQRTTIRSPYHGRVIGMALDQVVIPGFAAYHVGIAGGQLDPEPQEVPPEVSEPLSPEGEPGMEPEERPE